MWCDGGRHGVAKGSGAGASGLCGRVVLPADGGDARPGEQGDPRGGSGDEVGPASRAAAAQAGLQLVQQRTGGGRVGLQRQRLIHPGERPREAARGGLLGAPGEQGRHQPLDERGARRARVGEEGNEDRLAIGETEVLERLGQSELELTRRREAVRGVAGEAALEDGHQRVRDGRAGAARVLVRPGEDALERRRGARRGEGEGARPEPVQQRAQGEDVRLGRRRLALHHLGGHVRRRAHQRSGDGHPLARVQHPRDAEVHQLQDAVVADHHVLGLEVAVDDARLVRVPQRPGELLDHQRGQLGREEALALGEALERLAPDQLGDQERVLGGRWVGEVEHLEDVGVLQPRHRPGLAGQPRAGVLLLRQVRVEDLDRDLTVKRGVHAPVDDRHASRAERLEQPISPQVPALEAHPEMAPPESRNARLPRNVPHCSGLAAQEAMWSRTAPGKARFSPFPVRAFPASYAW